MVQHVGTQHCRCYWLRLVLRPLSLPSSTLAGATFCVASEGAIASWPSAAREFPGPHSASPSTRLPRHPDLCRQRRLLQPLPFVGCRARPGRRRRTSPIAARRAEAVLRTALGWRGWVTRDLPPSGGAYCRVALPHESAVAEHV